MSDDGWPEEDAGVSHDGWPEEDAGVSQDGRPEEDAGVSQDGLLHLFHLPLYPQSRVLFDPQSSLLLDDQSCLLLGSVLFLSAFAFSNSSILFSISSAIFLLSFIQYFAFCACAWAD